MVRPFSATFPIYRINPIGIATPHHRSTSPRGSLTSNINSLIPHNQFSLHYIKISDTIKFIKIAGQGSWLAKANISDAFKATPIHPTLRHLFGICWYNKYYFSTQLTFSCYSSLKIFDLHWNGHSLFYDNYISTSHDLTLFTEASFIGIGGFFCSQWFSSKYPLEIHNLSPFYLFLPATFPQHLIQAALFMSMFGSMYFCKQLFSLMKINRSAQRSRLNDKHLHSVLKIDMNPDIDKLVS
ncbi:GT2D2 protein, partial [Polyodon spathula]|nr:GT2D2 protein [Polyodon spathula]